MNAAQKVLASQTQAMLSTAEPLSEKGTMARRILAARERAGLARAEAVAATGPRDVDIVRLSEVEAEHVAWLWSDRIPRGKLTLLVGDPGAGKSFITLAIAAAITKGSPLPCDSGAREPANVLLWNGEDGIADTIRIRADAVGVDASKLFVIRGATDASGRRQPFSLRDVATLGDRIEAVGGVSMVVIDPVAALLSGVDAHRDADVRSALQPLLDLARDRGIAALGVLHLRKSEAQRALYRVGGSIGFVGMARSVLLAATDPEDGRRAVAPVKSNLAALAAPIEYRIDGDGRFTWGAAVEELDAEHLLRPSTASNSTGREAERFLREALAEGPRTTREILAEAETLGISQSTLSRARQRLRIVAQRVGGTADKGLWMLRMP